MKSEIHQWRNKVGLDGKLESNECELSVDYVISVLQENFSTIPLEELESLLSRIASYNIFLKAEKGRILARLQYLGDKYTKQLASATASLGADYQYKTREEKEVIVLEGNEELGVLSLRLIATKVKYSAIKDIPPAIDVKLEVLKTIYKRRVIDEQTKHQSWSRESTSSDTSRQTQ